MHKYFSHSFAEVKKSEEYSSFKIRVILCFVACLYSAAGNIFGFFDIPLSLFLTLSISFYFLTFAVLISLFHKVASASRRYFTLLMDITFTSVTIYLTAGESHIVWLLYVWLYIGYGTRYGKSYLFAAQIMTLIQYSFVVYLTEIWRQYTLDLIPHALVLVLLPVYLLSMIKRIQDAKNEAIEFSSLKTQFLASMSHEIRTPLNGIIGSCRLLRKTSLDPEQKKYSQALNHSSKILLHLIDDILDFSKIEANKVILEKNNINIHETIEQIINIFQPEAKNKQLLLSHSIAKDTPKIVIGDNKRLNQILINLIGNAIKYTQEGEVSVHINYLSSDLSSDLKNDKQNISFLVKDTGVGLSKEEQKIIFKRFTRVGKESFTPGTGLGTTISKELIEMMGGTITLKSDLNVGSEFLFTIQFETCTNEALTQNHVKELEQTENDSNKLIENDEQKSLNILIAEDDDINAMILEQFLIDLGHQSERAVNGEEAIDKMKKSKYDLIFMDLNMPKVSGIEATHILRKNTVSIPIVGLTANATIEHKDKCIQAGMNDFISKPITPEDLQAVIVRQPC